MKKLLCLMVLVLTFSLNPVWAGASETEQVLSEWAQREAELALDLGFVPISLQEEYQKEITREEFCEIAVNFTAMKKGYSLEEFLEAEPLEKEHYFVDTNNILVNKAFELGIISGKSADTFEPDALITRQEGAVMLANTYRVYTEEDLSQYEGKTMENLVTDFEEIAPWAQESVRIMHDKGVMLGADTDFYSPLDSYSREQCIVTFLRLHEKADPYVEPEKPVLPISDEEREILEKRIQGEGGLEFFIYSYDQLTNYSVINGYTAATSRGSYSYLIVLDNSTGEFVNISRILPDRNTMGGAPDIYELVVDKENEQLFFEIIISRYKPGTPVETAFETVKIKYQYDMAGEELTVLEEEEYHWESYLVEE